MIIRFIISLFIVLQLISSHVTAQTKSEDKYQHYPIPTIKNILFYIQRNNNSNTIIYQAKILPSGKLDHTKPVEVYWIRYAEKSQRRELNYIENVFAYGINIKQSEDGNNKYILTFAASKAYPIQVYIDKNGTPSAQMLIQNKQARLEKIFVQAQETSWLPKVKFVEIFGVDLSTNEKMSQKIYP